MALERAFQFCLDPKRPCMTTIGCDLACSWGEGLGVSVNERLTGGVSLPADAVVAMDRVRIVVAKVTVPGWRRRLGNSCRSVCLALTRSIINVVPEGVVFRK
jgi:hypothetical protein